MSTLIWDLAIILLSVGLYVLCVFCFVLMFKKAGLGYWGLLSLLPIMMPILFLFLAFEEWPIAEKTEQPSGGRRPSGYSPS